MCCNISVYPLKPLKHIQPHREVKRRIPLMQRQAAGLNIPWRREALRHHAKLIKTSISYNMGSLRLEKQLPFSPHLIFSWKKHQTNRFWTHLYSLCQDVMLIDPNGYGCLISKVILCLAVPGFASTPLLKCGIIITCRKEFVQFPAFNWQQPAAPCCFSCFHNSAEFVPLEQGQMQADAMSTFSLYPGLNYSSCSPSDTFPAKKRDQEKERRPMCWKENRCNETAIVIPKQI